MVAYYAQNGRPIEALNAYRKMNDVGLESELAVSTALIDMYMKCSSYNKAMDIFNQMAKKDVVSWAAIIGGYTHIGLANESWRVFKDMLLDGSVPDAVTMMKVLGTCSQLGFQHQTVCLHGYLVTNGFENKVFLSAAGYEIHDLGSGAIATFEHMIESSFRPNSVVFVSILFACSHAGLVEEGRRIFDSMYDVYGVFPDTEHYVIMVDLLGRARELHDAMMLIERIPKPIGTQMSK